MNRLNRVMSGAAVALALSLTHTAADAQIGPDPRKTLRPWKIAGLWDVEVTVKHCVSGATLNAFDAMHKFELGGTGQIVPSSSPTALSAHMMIWSHVKGDDFLMAAKMYRFDANGNSIGWIVLTNEVTLNSGADEYTGSGLAEIYDANGNLVATSCPQLDATRFTGEE